MKVPLDGGPPASLIADEMGPMRPAVFDGYLYWISNDDDFNGRWSAIRRIHLVDGSSAEDVFVVQASFGEGPTAPFFHGGKIYWGSGSALHEAMPDGSAHVTLSTVGQRVLPQAPSVGDDTGFIVPTQDQGWLRYAFDDGSVHAVGYLPTISDVTISQRQVVLEGDWGYISDARRIESKDGSGGDPTYLGAEATLVRTALMGASVGQPEGLVTLATAPMFASGSIVTDGSSLYYTLSGSLDAKGEVPYADGMIMKYDRATGSSYVLAAHQDRPLAIAVDARYVYWTTVGGIVARVVR